MKYETFRPVVKPAAPYLGGHKITRCRVPNQYDADAASAVSGVLCLEPTLTQQQFKEETDINTIAKNFGITGRLPQNVRMPMYGDFCEIEDYQGALNAARRAAHSFMQMPADVRLRFENDPQQFLEFCGNPANRDEAVKLGLVPSTPVPPTVPPPPEAPKPM